MDTIVIGCKNGLIFDLLFTLGKGIKEMVGKEASAVVTSDRYAIECRNAEMIHLIAK